MPLLLSMAPSHPCVGHLGVEHRQLRQRGHGLHPALQAVLLPELQGLGLGRRLLGEVAAKNPLAAVGTDSHLPLFAVLVPLHPRHFAGEVGVLLPGLAEDALLHQLCTEGLGGLESCCVGLGLRDAWASEMPGPMKFSPETSDLFCESFCLWHLVRKIERTRIAGCSSK